MLGIGDTWAGEAPGGGGLMRFLAVLALVGLLSGGAISQKKSNNIDSLKGNLKSVARKSSTVHRELQKTKKAVRVVKGDLQTIDGRLGQLESDLEATHGKLEKSMAVQKDVARDLQRATETAASTREQVRKRLRWMYVRGEESIASFLLGSKSLHEFASRGVLLQRISKADRSLFERHKAAQADCAKQKRRADAIVAEVRDLENRQKNYQYRLSETKEDKRVLLGQLREKQSDLEKLARQLDAEEDSIRGRIAAYYRSLKGSSKTPVPKYTGAFIKPVSAPMTSRFGMRFHPILKRNRMHTGVDFGARSGSPIWASADGVVIAASYSRGYGNMVIIDHGGGVSTLYGHCSRLYVSAGQKVKKGQRIGAVGSTGLSTGPHLHFEVRVNGRPVNPLSKI